METLRQIINCLRPSEVQTIKCFYRLKGDSTQNKRKKLFQFLLEGQVVDDLQASMMLYNKKPNSAYFHLKKRLQEDLLNFLMLFPLEETANSSEARAEVASIKLLVQAKMLLARGVFHEASNLLKRAFQLAGEYEFMNIKIAVKDSFRSNNDLLQINKGRAEFIEDISEDIELFKELLIIKESSFTRYETLTSSLEEPEVLDGQVLEKIRNSFERTGSRKIEFWHYLATIKYHSQRRDFAQAYESGQGLLQFLERQPTLKDCQNSIFIYLEMAKILLRLNQYDLAKSYILKAQPLLNPGMCGELSVLEVLFFTHMRTEEYACAQNVINSVISNKRLMENKYVLSKWKFFAATLLFIHGRYKESTSTLNTYALFKKDEVELTLGSKILELLNIIELQDYDWFDFKIENFRKSLSTNKSRHPTRVKHIYQLFKTLVKYEFDFSAVLPMIKGTLLPAALAESTENSWDPLSYEIINVDQWIISKS